MKELLTIKEAATILRLSPAVVYALCQKRIIRHERHGLRRGKILIPEEAIEEFRQSRTIQTKRADAEFAPPIRKPRKFVNFNLD